MADADGTSQGRRRRTNSMMGSAPDDTLPAHHLTEPGSHRPRARRSSHGNLEEEVDDVKTQRDKSLSPNSFPHSASDGADYDSTASDEGLDDDEETGLTGKERRKRRRRKRSHMNLDSRVVQNHQFTKTEIVLVEKSIIKSSLINAVLIGLWYFFSLSISLYNKWMFSPEHLDFRFPLFTTSVHMLVQFSMASMVLYFLPRFRPRQPVSPPVTPHIHGPESDKPLMSRFFYLTRIGPCGAATGLDIGLGNMSLKYIRLTFYTMCKSSSLAFVLIFAFIFHLETPSIRLVLIIATMTVGVIMMVFGELQFSLPGFLLVITASGFSGFRWALTQILLLRNPATSNPFSSIFFLAPVMFISIMAIALPVEGPGPVFHGIVKLVEQKGILVGPAILLFPGVLAFCMTASEFALLQRTSVVTLSICGIFKEVITITAAGFAFDEPLTPINVSGLVVTLASIAAYNYIKIRRMVEDARGDLKGAPIPTDDLEDSDDGRNENHMAGSNHSASSNATFHVPMRRPSSSSDGPRPEHAAMDQDHGSSGDGERHIHSQPRSVTNAPSSKASSETRTVGI